MTDPGALLTHREASPPAGSPELSTEAAGPEETGACALDAMWMSARLPQFLP